MDLLKEIGYKIKNRRIEMGMSQDELSKISGVQRCQISKIESGQVDVQISTIEKLASSLNMVLPELFKKSPKYRIHPFVKWAGGKKKLLSIIEKRIPSSFNTYFEPFVGGGALLFHLQPSQFVINDTNEELICVYRCLQDSELFELMKKEIIKHEQNHSNEYFYKLRELDKKKSFKKMPIYVRAARMIYLNKACFGGLYRVNSSGYFNVPSGKKVSVSCFDRKTFDNLPKFFANSKADILCGDFIEAVRTAKKGDFVYFDPPYDSWENVPSFTDYNEKDFTREDQVRLQKCVEELTKKEVKVMISNHNTEFIRELYKDYSIEVVPVKRMISSSLKGRKQVEEVIITNY